jgi:hypothetical protein
MQALIKDYQSFPGEHCGSVAMRGLLHHYCGLDLPEHAVFGLGAGVDCSYLASSELDPAILIFGRTMSMEVDIAAALDIDYREQVEPDDDKAWRDVCQEVSAGRPTMLSGDIFYLDYREFKVHFPGHRFVLVGFDDDVGQAVIADRIRPEFEVCSYDALAKSRNPRDAMTTNNLWGKFHSTEVGRTLEDAAGFAIARCAERMLGSEAASIAGPAGLVEMTGGIAGIRRLAEELPAWAARDDAQWVVGYAARSIEKFGNGGGFFRRLYAGFLEWARDLDASLVPGEAPVLARAAADRWTELSATLFAASEDDATADLWSIGAEQAAAIAEVELRLFQMLARRT